MKYYKTHGKTRTPIHDAWRGMRSRCSNPNIKSYKDYGARGIKVCKRWDKFENFYKDMGDKPTPQHTLDRINNEKDYKPSNCRWATRAEQNLNTRRNTFLTYKGVTQTLVEWGKETGINRHLISSRLRAGWAIKDVLNKRKFKKGERKMNE